MSPGVPVYETTFFVHRSKMQITVGPRNFRYVWGKNPKSAKTKSVRLCIYNPPEKCEVMYIQPLKTARVVLEKFDRKV